MNLPAHAWVVTADGGYWRIFTNSGDALKPRLTLVEEKRLDNPPDHEQGTDRPGRTQMRGSARRTAMPTPDFHREAEDRFAAELADRLYQCAHAGQFEQLFLSAAPAVLGVLRQKLHAEVKQRIKAEIAKDFAHHSADELPGLFGLS